MMFSIDARLVVVLTVGLALAGCTSNESLNESAIHVGKYSSDAGEELAAFVRVLDAQGRTTDSAAFALQPSSDGLLDINIRCSASSDLLEWGVAGVLGNSEGRLDADYRVDGRASWCDQEIDRCLWVVDWGPNYEQEGYTERYSASFGESRSLCP